MAGELSIAVLMTSFNRREQTLECLAKLFAQTVLPRVALHVVLVDDASRDGTAVAVRRMYPQVEVIEGTGHLYWNQGMRLAFARALRRGFDYYLLLNDDTKLYPGAVENMLRAARRAQALGGDAVIAGATCDELTGEVSYGGQRWKQGWRRELELVAPDGDELAACDTMNGNCTLVPGRVASSVGNLDGRFTHSFGDFDYGFRARKAGFSIFVAPAFVGTCSDNSRTGTWRDSHAGLLERWRHLNSVKGSPFPEWSVYCRRHLGALWPLYAVSPYVKTVFGSLVRAEGAGQSA